MNSRRCILALLASLCSASVFTVSPVVAKDWESQKRWLTVRDGPASTAYVVSADKNWRLSFGCNSGEHYLSLRTPKVGFSMPSGDNVLGLEVDGSSVATSAALTARNAFSIRPDYELMQALSTGQKAVISVNSLDIAFTLSNASSAIGQTSCKGSLLARRLPKASEQRRADAPKENPKERQERRAFKPAALQGRHPSAEDIADALRRGISGRLARIDQLGDQCKDVEKSQDPFNAMACLMSGMGSVNSQSMRVTINSVEVNRCRSHEFAVAVCQYKVDSDIQGSGAFAGVASYLNDFDDPRWIYASFKRSDNGWDLMKTYQTCSFDPERTHCRNSRVEIKTRWLLLPF
jgi:hypothetical protein